MKQENQTHIGIRRLDYSFLFLLVIAAVLIFGSTFADLDLWGHVRFGIDILQSGEITRIDPYSYVSGDQPWINHEWLTEVVFAAAYLTAGSTGLIVLKLIVGFLTVTLIYRHLLLLKIKLVEAALLFITMGTSYLVIQTVRPQIFTFLFYTVTMLIIYKAEKGDYRWLWVEPIVIVFWTNLHGGYLSGIGILAVWFAAHLVFTRSSWKKITLPIVLSVLAPLVNPYGIELFAFLLRTATVPRPEIIEWQPMVLASEFGVLYGLTFGISVLGLVFTPLKRKPVPMILFGVAMLLPWIALRLLPMFSITSIIMLAEYISSALNKVMPSKEITKGSSILFGSLGTAGVITLIILSFTRSFWQIKVFEDYFPDNSIALIRQSGISGNMATDFNWGEYIIWHLGPEVRVSMDGRRETVYSERIYRQYGNFIYGTGNWDQILDANWTDMVLIGEGTPTYNLMKLKPGWMLVFEDANSALFVKENSPLVETLQQGVSDFSPPGPNRFFP
ncbi:MAG: hypothetical protein JXA13_00540 [Anaerolineales bacterium]|nr:hypothetical protein [Anaerolineales bacterium]